MFESASGCATIEKHWRHVVGRIHQEDVGAREHRGEAPLPGVLNHKGLGRGDSCVNKKYIKKVRDVWSSPCLDT